MNNYDLETTKPQGNRCFFAKKLVARDTVGEFVATA
jgi:hypothetical protein